MYDDLVQNKLSLKSLRGKLSAKFKRLNRGTSREDSALKIWETKKVNDRPKNNYIKKSCSHCGKSGHLNDDCWDLEKNKPKLEAYKAKQKRYNERRRNKKEGRNETAQMSSETNNKSDSESSGEIVLMATGANTPKKLIQERHYGSLIQAPHVIWDPA